MRNRPYGELDLQMCMYCIGLVPGCTIITQPIFIFTYASQFYPEYLSSAVLPLVSFGCPSEGGKICLLNFILVNKNELSYATYTVQIEVKLDVFLYK